MTLNSEELLPCPFCGSPAKLYHRDEPSGWSNTDWVNCENEECGGGTCLHETKEIAISAWNRRAIPPVDGLEVVAFRHPESDWAHVQYSEIDMHCRKDGLRPIPLVTLSQASSVIAGLERHNQALLDKVSSEDCACAYDGPDDVCLGHSPKLKAAEARISSLEKENNRLRAVVSASAAALGNGAFISTEASVEFMELLPVEIKAFLSRIGDHNG